MLISKNWLNKYVDLSKIDNKKIIEALNNLGLEFEELIDYSRNEGFVLGRVSTRRSVANSNKLNFTLVDIGEDLVSPIVCGADNVHEEQYVLVAKPGAILFDGTEIVERKILDKNSLGMICSLHELGIDEKYLTPDEIEGIVELKENIDTSYENLGSTAILQALNFDDTFFDIDLTLNRSDCLAEFVIAKELANYFNLNFKDLELFEFSSYPKKIKSPVIKTEVKSFLTVKYLTSRIEPSPITSLRDLVWVKQNNQKAKREEFLINQGFIATIETGQPLIIIDASKIKKNLIISDTYENKKFGIEKDDLVLLDGDIFIHLIGGKFNEEYVPTNKTELITIIALNIETKVMRKQSKKIPNHDLNMKRYIKPLAQSASEMGILRFLYLIQGSVKIENISSVNKIDVKKQKNKLIKINLEYFNNFLGTNLKASKIVTLLKPLGFRISANANDFSITAPEYRTDINHKSDLAEEIARIYGYNNIESKPFDLTVSDEDVRNPSFELLDNVSNICLGQGFSKIKTYSLTSKENASKYNFFKFKKLISTLNKLNSNREYMRPTLLNGLLDSLIFNNNRKMGNQKYFTTEKVYHEDDFFGSYHLCVVGQENIIDNSWSHQKYKNSFFYMKGLVLNIFKQLNFNTSQLTFKSVNFKNEVLNPYQSAEIIFNKKVIGIIGLIHPKLEKELKINKTYFFEIQLKQLFDNYEKNKTFFNKYITNVSIKRDITIVENDTYNFSQIKEVIKKSSKLIKSILLIDYYNSPLKKTLTISITFNSDKQLNELEIKKEFDNIVKRLKSNNLTVL